MAVEQYNLTFTSAMEDRPILSNLAKKFNLTTVLRKAQLSQSAGWVQVAFHGDSAEIQRAIADLQTQGVTINPIHLRATSVSDANALP